MMNKTLKMMMVQDIVNIVVNLIGSAVVFFVLSIVFIQDDVPEMMDIVFFILVITFGAERMSCRRFGDYVDFGFCRKRFYKQQLVLSVVNAFVFAIIRTFYQWVCMNDYIKMWMLYEETDVVYHKISILEIFIANVIIFMLMNIIFLITATFITHSKPLTGSASPQLAMRMNGERRIKKNIILCIQFVLMIVVILGLLIFYQIQMTRGVFERVSCMAIMFIMAVVLAIIGGKRYTPKYI